MQLQQRGTLPQPSQCDLQTLSYKTQQNYASRLQKWQLQNRISTPKRKKHDFEAILKDLFLRKIILGKMQKHLLLNHRSQPSCSDYNTICDSQRLNTIVFRAQPQQRETLLQPVHCDLHKLNRSTQHSSSNAQSVCTHANHNSTASTKKRKSHLEPSVTMRAKFETDSTAKRRRLTPSRARANISSQRNIRLPEKTHCFVQILAFKSHP